MNLRIKILVLAGLLPGAAILVLSGLLFCCCLRLRRRRRSRDQLNPAVSSHLVEPATGISPKLPKLHMPSKSSSSRASLRFHHLHEDRLRPPHHQQNSATNLQQQQQQQQQQPPFRWDEHPRLVSDAAETGWSRFVFTRAACDRADWPESTWEVPPGSSEFVQTVRLNPAIKKKSSIIGDGDGDDCSGCASSLRMTLPLPGPQLPASPFPQEAYFEITILYLDSQLRYSPSSSLANKRPPGQSDKAKLIPQTSADESDSVAMYHHNFRSGGRADKEFEAERCKHKPLVVSLGLSICHSPAVNSNSLPGTYPRSIGFHSNGAVYLDGMKLVAESEKSKWASVNRVIGCGFEPSKKKVFFTIDSQLKHVISCNSDAFASPLYPVLATNVDVMVSVNLGQSRFRYSPANAHRTANPCFVGSNSGDEDSMAIGYEDSGELFSMGRVDSGWLDVAKTRSVKSSAAANAGAAVDFDAESDLFEISLKD